MSFDVGVIGQSNTARWKTDGTDLTAVNVTIFNNAGSFVDPVNTGNGQISFGNQLAVAVADDVRMINDSMGSTSLQEQYKNGSDWWLNITGGGGTLWGNFTTRVNTFFTSGPDLIVWCQGERDALQGTSETDYYNALIQLFANIRAEWPGVPIAVIGLGRYEAGSANYQNVRNAQRSAVAVTSGCELSATTVDLDLLPFPTDGIHYTEASFIEHGTRSFLTAQLLLGNITENKGPSITGVEILPSAVQTRVTITPTGGTDFTPITGITGFKLYSDREYQNELAVSVSDQESTTAILLSHAASRTVYLRYMEDTNPNHTASVHDNSAELLPLEWGNSEATLSTIITVSGTYGNAGVPTTETANTIPNNKISLEQDRSYEAGSDLTITKVSWYAKPSGGAGLTIKNQPDLYEWDDTGVVPTNLLDTGVGEDFTAIGTEWNLFEQVVSWPVSKGGIFVTAISNAAAGSVGFKLGATGTSGLTEDKMHTAAGASSDPWGTDTPINRQVCISFDVVVSGIALTTPYSMIQSLISPMVGSFIK